VRYLDTGTTKKISKIGLGTSQFGPSGWRHGEDRSGCQEYTIVRRAVELGVTLFDTAEIYGAGHSERILGRALGGDRESVFIADKIFPLIPDVPLVKGRAAASAGRLGVSRLDLYQVHYPNPLVRDRTIMRGMRALQNSRMIEEVGVSNYSVGRWRTAEDTLGSRILSNQVEYSLVNRSAESDLLPFAQSNNRIIIAFRPLAQGLLSGRYDSANRPADHARATSEHFHPECIERTKFLIKVLREVADAHGASPAQIALAWVIRNPAVAAIPGASSVEQLESNVAAADINLADDEYLALQDASLWPREIGPQRSALRRKLHALRHCARAGRYLAMTLLEDFRITHSLSPGFRDPRDPGQ
jgi:aryl-alcohol dehydrogenase-like predicted oxidoreductase